MKMFRAFLFVLFTGLLECHCICAELAPASNVQSVNSNAAQSEDRKNVLVNGQSYLESFKRLPFSSSEIINDLKSGLPNAKLLFDTARNFILASRTWLQKSRWLEPHRGEEYFVRKLVLPKGSQIEFRGDLHGDIHSLVAWLENLVEEGWLDPNNPFKIIKENAFLCFLGDYTDRGLYGVETLFVVMQLYLHNPDKVLIVRGNHENFFLNFQYGFAKELLEKFGMSSLYLEFHKEGLNLEGYNYSAMLSQSSLMEIYFYMPVAIFIGSKNEDDADYVLACHGGLNQSHELNKILDDKEAESLQWIGGKLPEYQWNDFDFLNENPEKGLSLNIDRGGIGYILYQKGATDLLRKSSNRVKTVFRAHQHDFETISHILKFGNGVYRLWSDEVTKPKQWGQENQSQNQQWTGNPGDSVEIGLNSIWTFNVAPRTGVYESDVSNFDYDTVGRLKLEEGFSNWKLFPRKIDALKQIEYEENNQQSYTSSSGLYITAAVLAILCNFTDIPSQVFGL